MDTIEQIAERLKISKWDAQTLIKVAMDNPTEKFILDLLSHLVYTRLAHEEEIADIKKAHNEMLELGKQFHTAKIMANRITKLTK